MSTAKKIKKSGRLMAPEQAAAVAMVAEAWQRGLALTGPDRLLKLFTKNVLETALHEEMTEHLGMRKTAHNGVVSRRMWGNGSRSKTVISDAVGEVKIAVPRNLTFRELGDDFKIGTSTAGSYAHGMAEFFAQALGCSAEDLAEAVAGRVCFIDGTLVPTFHWRHRSDLVSGKHRDHGMNVSGPRRCARPSDRDEHRLSGQSTRQSSCVEQSRFAALLTGADSGVGDAGYQGCEVTTPIKKKPGAPRAESDIEFNTALAKIRVGAEGGIGHIKNWRILASRYRGNLSRIDTVIQAVTGLQIISAAAD